MDRHKCYQCGRLRNIENLTVISIPAVLYRLFDKRKKIYICKNFSTGHYSNIREASIKKSCLEKLETSLIIQEHNVSSGMTSLLQSAQKLSDYYKPFRFSSNK